MVCPLGTESVPRGVASLCWRDANGRGARSGVRRRGGLSGCRSLGTFSLATGRGSATGVGYFETLVAAVARGASGDNAPGGKSHVAARSLTRRPLLSLVTSRHRLLGADRHSAVTLLELVSAAVTAGVDLIQVREPDLSDLELFRLVASCVDLARGSSTAVLVNDRLDIALATGADGVHLKECSVSSPLIRPHVPEGFLLGRSVHATEDAVRVDEAGEVDYLQFGTVYSSRSKPETETCGTDVLEETARTVSLPVLAVGGITVDNSFEVFCAGAAGVAAIGLFAEGESPGDPDAIDQVIGSVRRAYVRSYAER